MRTPPVLNPPAPSLIEVEISDTQSHLAVDPDWLANLVRTTLALEGVERAAISVAVVDDASIRVINARHLSHDWATDVISFPMSDEGVAELTGELVVSAEMAVRTAVEARCEPTEELALYLVHGLLHLCGYDDQAAEDVAVIRGREATVLGLLGIENPFCRVGPLPAMSDDSGRESVRWPR